MNMIMVCLDTFLNVAEMYWLKEKAILLWTLPLNNSIQKVHVFRSSFPVFSQKNIHSQQQLFIKSDHYFLLDVAFQYFKLEK